MTEVKPRREIYAETTRRALLETGRLFFLERGYSAVSAEELVRAAGLTRGALYHHFDGKKGLFEAVFAEVQTESVHHAGRAMAAAPSDAQYLSGIEAFLDVCADRQYREIVLTQGPIALGWDRWSELDRPHLRWVLTFSVRGLVEAGRFAPHPPDLIVDALYGTLTTLGASIAADPGSRPAARAVLRSVLDSFAA